MNKRREGSTCEKHYCQEIRERIRKKTKASIYHLMPQFSSPKETGLIDFLSWCFSTWFCSRYEQHFYLHHSILTVWGQHTPVLAASWWHMARQFQMEDVATWPVGVQMGTARGSGPPASGQLSLKKRSSTQPKGTETWKATEQDAVWNDLLHAHTLTKINYI